MLQLNYDIFTFIIIVGQIHKELTSRNYMANLTYYCGAARKFMDPDGNHVDSVSMTCQWNEEWTASTVLPECDWVECLQPPKPPAWTNLR